MIKTQIIFSKIFPNKWHKIKCSYLFVVVLLHTRVILIPVAKARWAKVLRVGKICGLDTRGSDAAASFHHITLRRPPGPDRQPTCKHPNAQCCRTVNQLFFKLWTSSNVFWDFKNWALETKSGYFGTISGSFFPIF